MLHDLDENARAAYARVAVEFRAAARTNELRAQDRHLLVVRISRMLRVGPDGPEPPRPSDVWHATDEYPPAGMVASRYEDRKRR
ncbi:hypothetical protein B4N89_46940 [Embleya scabrispora]|uniref:Uncharacterized protein n=1 Tax=Embleya scabrispora TaxID=159449 RepID=A0A1T3NIY4_9ACTN|nr:hypothetical protein B4N89_46940 [Embleya scabrispora]